MTAIVGVLNKHAVAIAADSAVTIGGKKVFNSANKIFALSRRAPVAIATFNNANLNDVPWEIVIKEYRKHLGDTKKARLKDYVDDFFEYIKSRNYFSTTEELKESEKQHFSLYLNIWIKKLPQDQQTEQSINTNLEHRITELRQERRSRDCFNGLSLEEFASVCQESIDYAITKTSLNLNKDYITEFLYSIFICKIWEYNYSGLVFTGYGEDEIYPSLYSYRTYSIINEVLHIEPHTKENAIIGQKCDAAIRPFAQRDVMDTIIFGIAPIVEESYKKTFNDKLQTIIHELEGNYPEAAKIISGKLPNILDEFIHDASICANGEYVQPFVHSIINLNIEDLADFAESLIKLTATKRKISPDQPTVGGPIDVMVISKGDGIIWMKRKHYFDPNLNHHFFENYNHQ